MKYIFLLNLLATLPAYGQPDTLRQPLSAKELNNLFALLHRKAEPTPLLFKWNALGIVPVGSDYAELGTPYYFDWPEPQHRKYLALDLDLEAKIAPWITVDAGVEVVTYSPDVLNYKFSADHAHWSRFRIEPRFYWQHRDTPVPNALDGYYWSVEYASAQSIGIGQDIFESGFPKKEQRAALYLGLQRRVRQLAWVDFSYGFGVRSGRVPDYSLTPRTGFKTQNSWFFGPRIKAGLVLQAPGKRHTPDNDNWQRLYSRYSEQYMVRIGLNKVLDVQHKLDVSSEIPITFEYKLAGTAWSLLAEGVFRFGKYDPFATDMSNGLHPVGYTGFGLALEMRNYPGMKKRVAAGLSGSNLNGLFWGIRTLIMSTTQNGVTSLFDIFPSHQLKLSRYGWMPVAGWQYRIQRHIYLGYEFGLGPASTRGRTQNTTSATERRELYWFSNFQAGLVF